MNYIAFHLGDYAAGTAHLSWDEDMALMRLLRAYYHTEKPIPKEKTYRMARASTPSQRLAVDTVIAEFFTLIGDHYHQRRCDEEIERYRDKQTKAQKSANERWKKPTTHSEGNADAMRSHSEGNANQEPRTNNQEHIAAAVIQEEGEYPEDDAAPVADATTARINELATLLRTRGASIHASDLNVRNWAETGVSDEMALKALESAQQRRADASSDQPIGSCYLNAILNDLKKDTPWWSSDERMLDKAVELGIEEARPGESRDQFRERIKAKQSKRRCISPVRSNNRSALV